MSGWVAGARDVVRPYLTSVSEPIYDIVKERILSLELTPGEQLVERSLASEFGVSQTPIREALQRLVFEGLAKRDHARGVFVRDRVSDDVVRNVYELRLLLEPVALEQSAPGLTPEDIALAREQLDSAAKSHQDKDLVAVLKANRNFHLTILSRAENALLLDYIRDLHDLQRFITIQEWRDRDRVEVEQDEHLAILDALASGFGFEAVQRLRAHISFFLSESAAGPAALPSA